MRTTSPLAIDIDKSSTVPIYRQVATGIRAMIAAGDLAAGDKLPSEADLARRLGISPMTARQAYTELANAGAVGRSHGRGTFVQEAADTVAERTSTDLLLLGSRFSAQPFFTRLLDACAQACDAAGWNLHLSCHRERGLDHQGNAVVASLLGGGQVDAVLAAGPLLDRDVERLAGWAVPVLLLDHEYLGGGVYTLRFDDERFVRQAVARLAAAGCRRIGVVPGPLAEPGSRFRRRGDRMLAAMPEACAAAGVPWLAQLAQPCGSDEESATMAVAELMGQREPPDALVVHGDSAARAARRILAAGSSTVPVATFADDPAAPGAVAAKPFAALARMAVETFRRIRDRDPAIPACQIVPTPEPR